MRAEAGRLMGADMTWVLRLYVNENPCGTNPYMWTPERAAAWPVLVSQGNGSESNPVLYLSHALDTRVAVVPLLSALAKRGRFQLSKSQRKEPRQEPKGPVSQ